MVNPNEKSSGQSTGAKRRYNTRERTGYEQQEKQLRTDCQNLSVSHQPESVPGVAAAPVNYEITAPVIAATTQDLMSDLTHATTRVSRNPPEKAIVDEVVRQRIFPKVKFIDVNDTRLEYSEEPRTICKTIMEGCNVGPHIDKRKFWQTAHGWLLKRLSNVRTDVTSQIKKNFWGKYCVVFCRQILQMTLMFVC